MMDDDQLSDELHALTEAVRRIAYGGVDGPTGLEALVMSLAGAGRPGHDSLASAIRDAGLSIECGLDSVAKALRDRSA